MLIFNYVEVDSMETRQQINVWPVTLDVFLVVEVLSINVQNVFQLFTSHQLPTPAFKPVNALIINTLIT